MHVAILGTGHMATTLGRGILSAGHTVTFGSRAPEAHTDLPSTVVGTVASLDGSDLVISALRASTSLDALSPLADELGGRVLLDIGNAVTPDFALMYPNDSLAANLQAALPNTRVVKSLNTLAGKLSIDPSILAETSVFLSGDDAEAKSLVSSLLVDLGWPTSVQVDLGGIATARGAEHYFLLFATFMRAFPGETFNIKLVRSV